MRAGKEAGVEESVRRVDKIGARIGDELYEGNGVECALSFGSASVGESEGEGKESAGSGRIYGGGGTTKSTFSTVEDMFD